MTTTHSKFSKVGFLEDQRPFFDQLIENDWNSYLNDEWDAVRTEECQKIIQHLPISPATILDIGCGCGFHDKVFASSAFVKKVVGVDYSEKSISRANESYPHPKIQRKVSNILDEYKELRSEIGTFDLVCSFQVIEHVKDAAAFLEIHKDFTSPGGYIAIGTPNWKTITNRIKQAIGVAPALSDPMHYREFTPSDLDDLARKIDLAPVAHFGLRASLSIKGITILPVRSTLSKTIGKRYPSFSNSFVSIYKSKQ